MSDEMGAVRLHGHLLAAIAGAAVALAGCSDADPATTATSSPRATPHATSQQPEATATPVRPTATPTPAEVPSGPDDPGWAEHLGLTEEELERRRASDDFLEWAEPRRARESPGADRTFRRTDWIPHGDHSRRISFVNAHDLWEEVARSFRDYLLASGASITAPPKGLSAPYGYIYLDSRDQLDDPQQWILLGFFLYHGDVVALIDQVLIDIDFEDGGHDHAVGSVSKRRTPPIVVRLDERSWDDVYQEDVLEQLEAWEAEHR